MPSVATAAVVMAFLLDLITREFPESLHPVTWYGRSLKLVDRNLARPRLTGTIAAVGFPIVAAMAIGIATAAAGQWYPALAVAVAGAVLFATTSLRLLLDIASEVVDSSVTDPESARDRLPALVGRDPQTLTPEEIRSAAVESAAENLSDGLVAPLLAFVLFAGSLPLAAGAATWVKAVNTGDSMLGYRSKPVGWAFARLDDAVMWIPARLSGLLIAAAALNPGAILRARQWVSEPASPNAGWPMATLAAALNVRLEKPGAYVLNGDGPLPTPSRARHGIHLIGRAGFLAFVGGAVVAWF